MKRKAMLKIAVILSFIVSVLYIGQITALADDVKLTHEYNFDNDSGTTVLDSANENTIDGIANGTNSGAFVTGYNEIGNARQFNGTDDYISFSDPVIPIGAKSIRFKIRKDASTVANTDCWKSILSTHNTKRTNGLYIGIGPNYKQNVQGGVFILITKASSDIFMIQTPTSVCDGQWHDILFTWDGTTNTNSVKLYLDDMTTPVAQTTASTNEGTERSSLSIGHCDYTGNKGNVTYFNGYLDNIQFYSSVLTQNSGISNLNATGGDSKVDLTWNAVTDATSYTIKRSTTSEGPYTTIATGITGTSYSDTDVTNGITYYYIVTAIVNGSESWNSNEASATPQASTNPTQPIGNKALLIITMVTGERKEYEMTADKINDFIAWYNSKAASSPTYVIEKDYNKASFTSRKDYIAYDQISNFEVNEYNQ